MSENTPRASLKRTSAEVPALPQPYVLAMNALRQSVEDLEGILAARFDAEALRAAVDRLEGLEIRFRVTYFPLTKRLSAEHNQAAVDLLEQSRVLYGRAVGRLPATMSPR
jgi:hypothetical protein